MVDPTSEQATVEHLDFHMLGPLEVRRRGEPVPLGTPLQHALLAALLVEAGRTVPVATLMNRLWDDTPPDTATKSIQKYISNLRRALGSGRIDLDGAGYRLLAGTEELDVTRFE